MHIYLCVCVSVCVLYIYILLWEMDEETQPYHDTIVNTSQLVRKRYESTENLPRVC